jgi:NAD(P)-dependent dehydrogenase (short-subunit alcohol dehydrogenase family)
MGRLDGKVAVVTGGAQGMGEATARRFVQEGACVVIADVQGERGTAIAKTLGDACVFVRTDVSKGEDIRNAIERAVGRFGRLDILFNNAGVMGGEGLITECSEERWERIIHVNLKGPWLGMKYGIPHMIRSGGGSIISTASHAGDMGIPFRGAYGSSKGGIMALTRVAAIEAAPHHIRVNCIVPGATITGMVLGESLERPERTATDMTAVEKAMSRFHPLRRPGYPEDIANTVLWLASDESSFITGLTIPVDGGWSASPRVHGENIFEEFGPSTDIVPFQ